MGVLDRLKAAFGFGGADVAAKAQPVAVNISLRENEAIAHALYRIDAVQRYCAQKREEGREIEPARMEEFRTEIRQRAAYLLSKKQVTPEGADEIARSIEEGR